MDHSDDKAEGFIKTIQNLILDNNQTNFKDSGFHLFKFDVDDGGNLTNLEEKSLDDNGNLQSNSCE